MVRALLRLEGYEVDLRNGMEDTPLHMACAAGQLDTARFLLDNGQQHECNTASTHLPGRSTHCQCCAVAQTPWQSPTVLVGCGEHHLVCMAVQARTSRP